MEKGRIEEVFQNPSHPYTKALIECLPGRGDSMNRIPGSLPPVTAPPDGCRFHPRCEHAEAECKTGEHPPTYEVDGTDHVASCVYYDPANRDGTRDVPIADDGADARADGGSDE
jgi:peptide/nickel transport system ATP-binding protein